MHIASILHSLDPQLDSLRAAASEDPLYQKLLRFIKNGCDWKSLSALDELYLYKQFINELSIHEDDQLLLYQTDRIFVPTSHRQHILELLHASHSGITKSRQLAKQLYFWPSLSTDVKNMVQSCSKCIELLPSKKSLPLLETLADYPLEHMSADLFSEAGRDYLAYADRFSGMVWCDQLKKTHTGAVTQLLDKWMLDFGYPSSMRTDGGPQFRKEFQDWCKRRNILHNVSSPYYPQSNGCLLYTSPSPRDKRQSRMPSSA